MKYFLAIGLFLILTQCPIHAQPDVYMRIAIGADYTRTPKVPSYQGNGHGNQISLRKGIGVGIAATNRVKAGIGIEQYSRREYYSCVYFPTPDNPPQRAYSPLINNATYGCEYSTDTRINFIEIPLFVSYDVVHRDNFAVFLELGYGYQFLTGRKTTLRNLQSNIESEEKEKSFFATSKQATRLSIGLSKNISPKISFNGSLMYKIDSFQSAYETIGLIAALHYKFGY